MLESKILEKTPPFFKTLKILDNLNNLTNLKGLLNFFNLYFFLKKVDGVCKKFQLNTKVENVLGYETSFLSPYILDRKNVVSLGNLSKINIIKIQ